jgi:hypothetical protein
MGKPQSIGIVLEAPHVVFAVWLDLIITVGSLASFSPSASQVVWRTCCPRFGKPSIRVNKDPCIRWLADVFRQRQSNTADRTGPRRRILRTGPLIGLVR